MKRHKSMNELSAQAMIVKAIQDEGSFALKLSHRFLVGVPDLLVHMRNAGTALMEVKLHKGGARDVEYELGVTALQNRFLKEAVRSGMKAGVISLYERNKAGIRDFGMTVQPVDEHENYRSKMSEHVFVHSHPEFKDVCCRLLRLYMAQR